LPPLTGFIPKWITIIMLRDINWVLIIFLLLGRLINLYFYLNLTFNILLTSFTLNSLNKPINSITFSLFLVVALNGLGVFPMIMYAMTLLYKSQRHWHTIYNLWFMSRNSGHRN
jgi:formate hydrogenlyase subunit 3/multisubunit Na+/H+ antiporter MnhD subunit